MNTLIPEPIARLPWTMLIPLALLTAFGAAVLHSAAGGSFTPYAHTHLLRFAVFLVMALMLSYLRLEWIKAAAFPAYAVVLFLLVLVEAIGAIGGGSQRWLNLGFFVLQPSEFMKPIIIPVLALFYANLPPGMVKSWHSLFPAFGLMALPVGMVLLQPDLGTAIAICFGGLVVMFLAGLPLIWFGAVGAVAAIVGPLAFFFVLHDYQRQRVLTFLHPEEDPLGTGYHIMQSQIAIGSGGMFGKGFGQGSQSHLQYLPEPHTDFIFATMAEEWGFAGGLFVLAMFGLILHWGTRVARNAPDHFSRLLASGMVATMFFYVAINLMMVMGLAPVVGIPLPFMSHGGSSMLTNMLCIGILMMVARNTRRERPSSFS